MPRRCSICAHQRLEEINRALVEGSTLTHIAALFRVSDDSLSRHRANHIPAALAKAKAAEEVSRADDLLRQVRTLQGKTLSILSEAEDAGDLRVALSAIREARGNVELLAKLSGELDEGATVKVLIAPTVQAEILEALAPYPKAKQAVADGLAELEP